MFGVGAGTVRWEGQCPKQTLSPHHDRKAGLTTGLPFLHRRAFTDQLPPEPGQSRDVCMTRKITTFSRLPINRSS